MSNACAIAALALVVLAGGCRAQKTGPDANYEQGSRIYQQLYATELDDAYGDPKMNDVKALLEKVDPRSVDADAAKRMLDSIESGRAALARQRADREKMTAAAAASVRAQSAAINPQQILADATPDAGPPADPFGPGAAIADINAASGGCLTQDEPFREQGTGATGTVYRVAKSPQCADKLPGLVGQVVLVSDGKIYRRTADPTEAKAPTPLAADGGPAKAPDGGAAPRTDAGPASTRDAGPAARPTAPAEASNAPDAGGETQIWIPGMPLPEGTTEPPPPPEQPQQ